MDKIENAFEEAEETAAALHKTARAVVTQANRLQKAAKEGNVGNLGKTYAILEQVLEDLKEAIDAAKATWPYSEDDVAAYLENGYVRELLDTAEVRGLQIYERDGQLIAYPSVLSILASDQSIRLDRKKAPGLRPTYLVDVLIKNQEKKPRSRATAFLSALHRVYQELIKEKGKRPLVFSGAEPVVQLDRIYRMFTSMPGSQGGYTKTDFARDLFELDRSDEKVTKRGFEVSFPSSTGTRSGKGGFTFIGRDGYEASYWGIRFEKVDQ